MCVCVYIYIHSSLHKYSLEFQIGPELRILVFRIYLLLLENFTMELFFADTKKSAKRALCYKITDCLMLQNVASV